MAGSGAGVWNQANQEVGKVGSCAHHPQSTADLSEDKGLKITSFFGKKKGGIYLFYLMHMSILPACLCTRWKPDEGIRSLEL